MLEKQNKYSIRKLTVGAASVLIGASFFAVNGKTVEADTVNDTNNADANKIVQESTGEKAPESTQEGLLKGTDKIDKHSSIESGTNINPNDAPVNVIYFTVLTPNKAHNKLTVKQVYKVYNQKELANILSLYL